MAAHELKLHPGLAPKLKGRQSGQPPEVQRPFWYCTCSRFCGGDGIGWVCYITQPRTDMKAGKPDRLGALALHQRHVAETREPEEVW
jgi:hypothetical protein